VDIVEREGREERIELESTSKMTLWCHDFSTVCYHALPPDLSLLQRLEGTFEPFETICYNLR
jgi:hypothetical protein